MIRIIWTVTLLLAAIGVAAVTRRAMQLFEPSSPPARFSDAAAMDAGFERHHVLTLFHIVPGLLFMVLGPLQFVRSIRVRRPGVHRWIGRVFLVSGLIVGVTALVMGPQVAIGGTNETAATLLFGSLFLFALVKAWLSIRRGKVAQHREWMIRAFAIGLAVATIRPIVGMFFATMRLTHLTPHEFFGTAFWLGFTIQSIAAEIWIDYTRRAMPRAKP
jgi:uncharacterized membrane protein